MPKSKLGFHIDVVTYPGQIRKILACQPSVIKAISNPGLLNMLHDQLPISTVFIARDWQAGDDFTRFLGSQNPIDAAFEWLRIMRPVIKQAPFAYWEAFNEMSNWDKLSDYAVFETMRQSLMASEGFRCAIGSFATGTPEIVGDDDKWPEFYPALQAAHSYRNILSLHEYGGLRLDTWFGANADIAKLGYWRDPFPSQPYEGWLFGRYRKVWNKHIVPNGFTNLRIALTEFGLDMVANTDTEPLTHQITGAWKTCKDAWARLFNRPDAEQFYFEQLKWADQQMQFDPYVVGATIFTWGTFAESLWQNHDIEGPCADLLVDYIGKTKLTWLQTVLDYFYRKAREINEQT